MDVRHRLRSLERERAREREVPAPQVPARQRQLGDLPGHANDAKPTSTRWAPSTISDSRWWSRTSATARRTSASTSPTRRRAGVRDHGHKMKAHRGSGAPSMKSGDENAIRTGTDRRGPTHHRTRPRRSRGPVLTPAIGCYRCRVASYVRVRPRTRPFTMARDDLSRPRDSPTEPLRRCVIALSRSPSVLRSRCSSSRWCGRFLTTTRRHPSKPRTSRAGWSSLRSWRLCPWVVNPETYWRRRRLGATATTRGSPIWFLVAALPGIGHHGASTEFQIEFLTRCAPLFR